MTIARFVAEMGVDPAGVRRGLDTAAGYIRQFGKTADQNIAGSLEKSNRAVSSLTSKVLALASALGVAFAIRAGLAFNRTVETATLGIASLITAQAELHDSNGRLLEGAEALATAQRIAADHTLALRIAGLASTATTEQLTEAFQQAVGVGLRYGLTLDEIRKITIGITQAAGALGVPMNQLNEEIRSLLAGNISIRNTRIATALGITNADVRRWQETGTLASAVLDRLKAFNVAGVESQKTWAGVTSNIREAFGVFMGDVTRPAFDAFKIAAGAALADVFDLDNAQISANFSGILRVGQRVFADLGELLAKAIGGAVTMAKEFNRWLEDNAEEVGKIFDTFRLVASTVGALLGDMAKLLLAVGATSVEAGFFRTAMVGAGLAASAIHTAFQGLVLVFTAIGGLIFNVLLRPLIFLNDLLAMIVGVVDDDMAAAFQGAANWGRDFLQGIEDGFNTYVDKLAESGTATDEFLAKLRELDLAGAGGDLIVGLPGGDIAGARASETKITPRKVVEDAEDGVAALEKLTTRLVTWRNMAEKAGSVGTQFTSRIVDAIVTAEKALASQSDKLSDDAIRLTIVLDKLRDAFLGLAETGLPSLSLTPVGRITDPGRASLLRGGAASTVALNGVRGMPGFTLPVPKAAPTPPPTQSNTQIRFNAAMSQLADGAGAAARGLWGVVKTGGLAIIQNIVSQLSPFALIVRSLSDAMEPLAPVLAQIAKIVGEVLAPIFAELAPIIQAFIPFFRALLQIVAPLVRAMLPILEAFVPIFEALFPVIKLAAIALTYLIQAASLGASILLRFVGNVVIVIGTIFKALAKAIDALPGVGAKGAIDTAQGIIDFGRGLLGAADAFKKTADSMDDARREINEVEIDHTVDGLEDLGDAATKTAAALMNVPTWFRIALYRYRAATPLDVGDGRTPGGERRRVFPGMGGSTGDSGGGGAGGGLVIQGDVVIDARTLSADELLDAIMSAGNKRARSQGVDNWSEVR